jgi:hypothetical protein
VTLLQHEDGRLALEGQVTVEDAEGLLAALRGATAVDLSACEHIHAAALQVLLALRPRLAAAPADPWLRAALKGLPS